MSKPIILCLIPLLYCGLVESCSLACGDNTRVCLNNVEGYLGADCSGLSDEIVCASESDPCMNQCLHTSPVLSKDGKNCQKCFTDETSGDEICPKCKSGETWCQAEKLCKNQTMACDGKCPLYLYPVLNGETCEQCPLRDIYLGKPSDNIEDYDYYYYDYGGVKSTRWCKQSNRCYDPPTEPCDQKCYNWNKWYCPSNDSCIDNTSPCQQKCNSDHFYCSENNTCVSQYDACGETCFGDRRYCSLTKSCLDEETPCGDQCPNGKKFCSLHERCQDNDEHCPCSNKRWGCTTTCSKDGHNDICNNSCHLKYDETLQKMEKKKAGEICVKNTYGQFLLNTPGSIRYLGKGECHPSYKLCPGTDTCIPKYQDQATMCKDVVQTTTEFPPF